MSTPLKRRDLLKRGALLTGSFALLNGGIFNKVSAASPVPVDIINVNQLSHGKVTTDIYLGYKITKNITWNLGADNLFNVHPDQSVTPGARLNSLGDSESGGPFDAVQMGFNGIRLFTKFIINL